MAPFFLGSGALAAWTVRLQNIVSARAEYCAPRPHGSQGLGRESYGGPDTVADAEAWADGTDRAVAVRIQPSCLRSESAEQIEKLPPLLRRQTLGYPRLVRRDAALHPSEQRPA